MLYNKDPILPFKYADRNDNLVHEHENSTGNISDGTNGTPPDATPISILIEKMETQKAQLFDKAKIKIKKLQEHQAK